MDLLEKGYALTERIISPVATFIFRPFIKRGRTDTNAFWTLPTLISISRATAGAAIAVLHDQPEIAIPLFLWGGVSDHLDGSLARKMGPTVWGVKMDAWCDRIFFLCCVAAYWNEFNPRMIKTMVSLELLVLSSPLLAIYVLRIKLKPEDYLPNIFGKWRFAVSALAIASAMAGARAAANACLAAAVVFVILACLYKVITSVLMKVAE